MTYCSTAFSVINANLKPILVDTKYMSPTIDLDKLKQKINKKTKVIMPVHLYGSVVDINKIKKMIGKKKFLSSMIVHKLMEPKMIKAKMWDL